MVTWDMAAALQTAGNYGADGGRPSQQDRKELVSFKALNDGPQAALNGTKQGADLSSHRGHVRPACHRSSPGDRGADRPAGACRRTEGQAGSHGAAREAHLSPRLG